MSRYKVSRYKGGHGMNCDRCGADNLTDLPVCPSCAREIHISYERQKMLRQIYGVSTNTSTISAPMPTRGETTR